MQRNANMLKILKKVRFCRYYGFLFKNTVLCLSPPNELSSFGEILQYTIYLMLTKF